MPEVIAEQAPDVVDFAVSDPKRTVQALRSGGVIKDDIKQTDVGVLKRINRARNADFSQSDMSPELQETLAAVRAEFNQNLRTKPYEELVAEGKVNQLLKDYLDILVKHSQQRLDHLEGVDGTPLKGEERDPAALNQMIAAEDQKIKKYRSERASYDSEFGESLIKNVASQYESAVRHDGFLPMGKLVVLSGAGCGPADCVEDLTNDVLGVQAARSLNQIAAKFPDAKALEAYAADPETNSARIDALARRIFQVTAPLSSLGEFETETPELDRIMALKQLASAQIHYAMEQGRTPQQRLAVEQDARNHMSDVAQVSLSLADDYLKVGAAKYDKRAIAIAQNLEKEVEGKVQLLPLEEATAKAAELARRSAEDLLQVVGDNEKLAARIKSLAKSAGVDVEAQPLAPKSQLIGEDLVAIIQQKLQDPHIIYGNEAKSFVERLRNEQPASLARGA